MKRLLRISFDQAFFSLIPILSWFMLGLIVDKNLINVFTITYPIQFIWALMKSIFGTAANISKEKNKNENDVLSGMTLGIIVGAVIFGLLAFHVESYVKFMNMDVAIYKEFTVYSILQLYIQFVFALVLEKLYYEGKEKIANKYCIQMNLINFIVLIVSASILKNKVSIIIITLFAIFFYTLVVTIKSYKKFKLEIHILRYIQYDSVDIFNHILFFIIFLFGLSNALEFGEKYALALNFVALITDTQWDSFEAIATTSKIDISKRKFNYKEHRNNAYKLELLLLVTVFIMFIIGFQFYDLDLKITLCYLTFELVNFLIYPIYRIKTCYLQLEYLPIRITTNKIGAGILRMIVSLLKTPYCTAIGQVTSSIYQFISVNFMFHKHFKITEKGEIIKNR